jgi:hypothetical protein
MLILNATTKSLEVVLGAAPSAELPYTSSYVDVTTTAFGPLSADGTTSGTTPVTVVAAPGASTQRQVKFLSVHNSAAAAATVTVQLNDNSTTRIIFKCDLAVGDSLHYIDSDGFKVLDSSGNIKTANVLVGFTEDDHKTVRQLIHFIEDGPAEGFASGAYRETTGTAFPTAVIWYDKAGAGKKKIVETLITWTGAFPTEIVWKIYDAAEVLLATITDTVTYSGAFETSRVRT